MRCDWIPTGKANKILNAGISDDTFRSKFLECVRWKLTPGGQYRWSREDVEALRDMDEDHRLSA